MALISRVLNKSWYYLHRYFLKHFGFGCRVRKDVWEKEFSSNFWDYLESKDEEGRYLAILDFYSLHSSGGAVLDIGCGGGVLFKYFSTTNTFNNKLYSGIDISEQAIKKAVTKYPSGNFFPFDYERSVLKKKYDVIIYNETLNYFNFPIKTLQKSFIKNLNPDGIIIISMYSNEGINHIWSDIEKRFKVIDHKLIKNAKEQEWVVKIIAS